MKLLQRPSALPARDVMAQVIAPTLHRQRWSLERAQANEMSRVVHLSAGRGVLQHADGELLLRAPDIVWLPAGQARSLDIDAGSAGVSVGVSDPLLAAAMGDQLDAAALRQVSMRLCSVAAPEGGPREELVRSLFAMEAEARRGVAGSRPYLAAHLTLVLVILWRLGSHEGAEPMVAPGPATRRLLRFRQLVEAQFRQHWTVARYATELGLSADGLHDLCTRTLARTPLALLHQRVGREACGLLAGTDLSVERLATELGFGSSSHFSRFFKRLMGVGPRAWRDKARSQAASGRPLEPSSYADWP